MGLLEYLSVSKGPFFTFKDHFGQEHTMRAKTIHKHIMEQSQESDYEWIAPALELVKICKDERFPREYAIDIEMAILKCFTNIEARVNRGGDKYVTKANDATAVQYCYDELGRLMTSINDKDLKKSLNSVRTKYVTPSISIVSRCSKGTASPLSSSISSIILFSISSFISSLNLSAILYHPFFLKSR